MPELPEEIKKMATLKTCNGPHSADLNPFELVWLELDRRVKSKQPSASHLWELLQRHGKKPIGDYLLSIAKRMPRVDSVAMTAKGGLFDELKV